MNSFRLRLTLLIVLLSSMVLMGMGWLQMELAEKSGLQAIDQRLQVMGRSQIIIPHPRPYWQSFENLLEAISGESSGSRIAYRIIDRQQNFTIASENFPELDTSHLPELQDGRNEFAQVAPPHNPSSRRDRGPPHRQGNLKTPDSHTISVQGIPYRLVRCGIGENELWLTTDLRTHLARMSELRFRFASITVAAVAILAVFGWWIGRRALSPIEVLSQTAASVTAQELSARINLKDPDKEFGDLIEIINSMLARLEGSFRQATRFTADAAHELQTPLTSLQLQLDDALQHASEQEQPRYAQFLEETAHLKSIVQKLLILAKADSGTLPLNNELVDLTDISEQLIEDVELLAPEIRVTSQLPERCAFRGDDTLLKQALSNLVRNAVRYNLPEKGEIHIQVRENESRIAWSIENTTNAVAPPDPDQLFDRFYRADRARERKEGLGLGLSLTREIITAHGGNIHVEFRSGVRACFVCSFPKPVV